MVILRLSLGGTIRFNIMISKTSDNTPNSTIHAISPDTSLVKLISNHNDIFTPLTYESQMHLSRIVARYITNCFNNRKKFLESVNADSCCNTWPTFRTINVHLQHFSTLLLEHRCPQCCTHRTRVPYTNADITRVKQNEVYQIKQRFIIFVDINIISMGRVIILLYLLSWRLLL